MEVMRLGPGDHFGEIGMLTGAPATEKITALTPVTVYELAKEDLAPILEARPQMSQELRHVLARRKAAGRSDATDEIATTVPAHRLTSWFSDRLHRLYDMANAERASRSPLPTEAHPDPMPASGLWLRSTGHGNPVSRSNESIGRMHVRDLTYGGDER